MKSLPLSLFAHSCIYNKKTKENNIYLNVVVCITAQPKLDPCFMYDKFTNVPGIAAMAAAAM